MATNSGHRDLNINAAIGISYCCSSDQVTYA